MLIISFRYRRLIKIIDTAANCDSILSFLKCLKLIFYILYCEYDVTSGLKNNKHGKPHVLKLLLLRNVSG